MERLPTVYILSNKKDGVLYIGVTSDLVKRVWEHKSKFVDGFAKKYGLSALVYFEVHERMDEAIQREKQLKKWRRQWKINLIDSQNPEWRDLWEDIT